jgi:DNA-directed RNA polymerase subunit K/omega
MGKLDEMFERIMSAPWLTEKNRGQLQKLLDRAKREVEAGKTEDEVIEMMTEMVLYESSRRSELN